MKRIDKGEGLTSLMHNDHTENWLVVRKNMTGAEQVQHDHNYGSGVMFSLPDMCSINLVWSPLTLLWHSQFKATWILLPLLGLVIHIHG